MTETCKVRTVREGEAMRHPTGALANNEGGQWPRDQFTARRLRDGDVELVTDANVVPLREPSGENSDDAE